MRLAVRVDPSADLRHPQLDAVVAQHREDELELSAGERTLRLADDERVPTSGPVRGIHEKAGRLGTPRPRNRPADVDVVVHGDDLAAHRPDELLGEGELPAP
jgi:hypothetical protein